MPIQYALFENNVTADPDDYMAAVQIGDEAKVATVQRVGRASRRPIAVAARLPSREPGGRHVPLGGPGQNGQRSVGPRAAYRTPGLDADGPADIGSPGRQIGSRTPGFSKLGSLGKL